MAETTKLVMTFLSSDGKNLQYSYKYAKPEATDTAINALMSGIISNGEIFARVPAAKKSAKMVVTSESEIEIS